MTFDRRQFLATAAAATAAGSSLALAQGVEAPG